MCLWMRGSAVVLTCCLYLCKGWRLVGRGHDHPVPTHAVLVIQMITVMSQFYGRGKDGEARRATATRGLLQELFREAGVAVELAVHSYNVAADCHDDGSVQMTVLSCRFPLMIIEFKVSAPWSGLCGLLALLVPVSTGRYGYSHTHN